MTSMATFGPFQRADMMSVPREDMKGSPTAGDFYHRRPTSIGLCEHEIASR
jgi:hypothetical protein